MSAGQEGLKPLLKYGERGEPAHHCTRSAWCCSARITVSSVRRRSSPRVRTCPHCGHMSAVSLGAYDVSQRWRTGTRQFSLTSVPHEKKTQGHKSTTKAQGLVCLWEQGIWKGRQLNTDLHTDRYVWEGQHRSEVHLTRAVTAEEATVRIRSNIGFCSRHCKGMRTTISST